MQSMIDDTYDQFATAVSEERGIEKTDLLKIADGRPLTGRQALEVGLVDKLGDLQAAIDVAADMARITGKPTLVRHAEKPNQVLDLARRFLDQKWDGPALLTGRPTFRLQYRVF